MPGVEISGPQAAFLPGPRRWIGWGRRPSGRRATWLSGRGGPTLIEDGFLNRIRPDLPRLSVVWDEVGIHYDATQVSGLDLLLDEPLSDAEAARARALRRGWVQHGVSKSNHLPEWDGELPPAYVLVADQVAGDLSLRYGQAGPTAFRDMLVAARATFPNLPILLKSHPNSEGSGAVKPNDLAQIDNVIRIAAACHPARLLAGASAVFTVTSQLGFEALLYGTPVFTFGMPFYAGRGLTTDALPPPEWRRPVTLDALSHAALARYARYRDPRTGAEISAEAAIALAGRYRRFLAETPQRLAMRGFSGWKTNALRRFFPGCEMIAHTSDVPTCHWGATGSVPGLCVEDGFLRSVGLGAAKREPVSWLIDPQRPHFDPRGPSQLEIFLQRPTDDPDLLARAARLRQRIVGARLGKYALGGAPWLRPPGAERVVLVVGQVEDDASLRFGPTDCRTNLALIARVRTENPGAHIVYRPHPDVIAGYRRRDGADAAIRTLADSIAPHADLAALVDGADEVHVMSSLAGFEALLRGRRVVCHHAPFYSGWGLTEDRFAVPRRRANLTLDQLVAAALILYPRYSDPATGLPLEAEEAVNLLIETRDTRIARLPESLAIVRTALRLGTGARRALLRG